MEGDPCAVNERERKTRRLFLSYNLKKSIYQLVKLKGRSQKEGFAQRNGNWDSVSESGDLPV